MTWRTTAAAAVMVVSCGAVGGAPSDQLEQAASSGANAILLAEVVVVAARNPQPGGDVVGTVSVIARAQIERQQPQDIRDLVRYEPGVAVTADPTRFGLDGFNIRGIQGNRVAVRVDGVPLADGFSVGSFSNAGRDLIEPELIERVEILRGPASALYGSDALGGLAAITTRDPRDLVRVGESTAVVRLGHTTRDNATRLSTLGAWQGEVFGALALLVRRDGHERENNPGPAALAANPAQTSRAGGLFKFTGSFDRIQAELGAERFQIEQDTDVRSLVNGPGQFATTVSLLADDRETRERITAAVLLDDVAPWLDEVQTRIWFQGTRAVQTTTQRRRAAPPALRDPTLRERQFNLAQLQQGVELTARSATRGLGGEQQWVYGIESSRGRVKERRDGFETNLTTGLSSNVVLGERLPVRDFPNSVLRTDAVFASTEWTFDDSRWSLLPGIRHDRFRVDARVDPMFAEDNPGRAVADTDNRRLTPKLGMRYAVGEHDRLYLAWAEGFRAPPFSDVNIALVLPQFNYVVLPNPALKAERSRGFELGWAHETQNATWRLAGFDNRYRELIESRANLGLNSSGAQVFQSVNRARAQIRGIEASAQFKLQPLGAAFEPYRVRLAFARARGDDTVREQPLNTVQPDQVVVGFERDAVGPWPELALIATAVAPVTRVDRTAANLFAPPGYVTFDLIARKAFAHGVTVDAAINNLGDVRYWDWASLRGVLRNNVPAPALYTASGRNVAVTVTLAW